MKLGDLLLDPSEVLGGNSLYIGARPVHCVGAAMIKREEVNG